MRTINELKANNDERDFFQFKTNFIRVQVRVGELVVPINNLLVENLTYFQYLELVYLDEYTGNEDVYAIEIYQDDNCEMYSEFFEDIINYYELVDQNNIVHLDKLLISARVDVIYEDGSISSQTFELNE